MYCAWRIPAHLRCTQCSILLHLMDICYLTFICLWQISQIQTFLCRVVGPGLVSTSPAFVSNSVSHPAGPHGRHAQKTVNRAPIAGGRGGSTQFAQFGSKLLHPHSKTWQGPFSGHFISANLLLCPAAEVLEASMVTTVHTYLLPVADQHRFRPGHSTTSALLQLTSDVTMGFNQRKPPHRSICVAVDITAEFHTTITYCYQSLQKQRFMRQPVDGCLTISEAANQLQATVAYSGRQG